MLKQNKPYAIKQRTEKKGVTIQLNELPSELVADIKESLRMAATHIKTVDNTNEIRITFNPTYNAADVYNEVESILKSYYAPVPTEFEEALKMVIKKTVIREQCFDSMGIKKLFTYRDKHNNCSCGDLSCKTFVDCTFIGADMRLVYLFGTVFENCNFTGADFSGLDVFEVKFKNCIFDDVNLDRTVSKLYGDGYPVTSLGDDMLDDKYTFNPVMSHGGRLYTTLIEITRLAALKNTD